MLSLIDVVSKKFQRNHFSNFNKIDNSDKIQYLYSIILKSLVQYVFVSKGHD